MIRLSRFRSLGLLFVIASNTLAAGNAAVGSAAKPTKASVAKPQTVLAPADQYFGPTKMSIVGMHTAIVDLGKRYHDRSITDTDIVHDAKIVETALYAWHAKYPKDSGAISTAFLLEQLYQVVQSTNARSHATTVLAFIAKAAPTSPQAHLSRLRLAQGFPALETETATHATPNPYTEEANRAAASPIAADGVVAPPEASGSGAPPASSSAPVASAAAMPASAAPVPASAAPSIVPVPASPTATHT